MQFFGLDFLNRRRDTERIAGIRTGEDVEKYAKIGGGARHRADDANPAKGTVAGRNVTGGWDAAGRWLESADAAEVRRDTNRAAAVAADSAERTARSDGRRFTATGAAGRVREIPRIAGGAGDAIVGFVSHEEFGRVRAADKNGSGRAKAFDDGRGARRNFTFAEEGAGGSGPACDLDAALHGDRDSVKRAGRFVFSELLCRGFCGGTDGVGVKMNEGV